MMPVLCFGQTADKFDNQENLYENYINLADSMFQLKDFEKSLEFYEKAISIFPKEMYPKDQIAVLTKVIEADNRPFFTFKATVNDHNGEIIKDVNIDFKKNSYVIRRLVTNSNGNFEGVKLPFGYVYTISFSKKNLVSKTIIIDTENGYNKNSISSDTDLDISIALLEKVNGIDYSKIKNNIVGRARIDSITGGLAWDNIINK